MAPGWIQPPVDVQREQVAAICRESQWVLDSAYATWIDIPLESVQLIVCLDYPRWISFGRLLRRTLGRALRQTVVCNGNVETLRRTFSRDSILMWHFKSFRRKRERMRVWAAEGNQNWNAERAGKPPFQVVVFRSPRQTRKWLAEIAG
ncbi:MAG TPA: adenylate kinase [Arthrobacter sp.]|nr:adenylate kinase [Arthrobacter sp.]